MFRVWVVEMEHVFEFVIPQILLQPNVEDPYKFEATDLYVWYLKEYKEKLESNFVFYFFFIFEEQFCFLF